MAKEIIGIYKVGQSLSFKPTDKNQGYAGKAEMFKFIKLICDNNPDVEFHLISTNDLYKFPQYNVAPNLKTFDDVTQFKYDNLYKHKYDKIILIWGPHGHVNIPNYTMKRDGSGYASPLIMFIRYAGPIVKYLIENPNVKIVQLCMDPRHLPQARDIKVDSLPSLILTQINNPEYISSGRRCMFNLKYAGIEKIFLYGMTPFCGDFEKEFAKKTNKLILLSNSGSPAPKSKYRPDWMCKRYLELIEYIGKDPSDPKYIPEVEICGKWPDEILKYDSRFKGLSTKEQNLKIIQESKATLISPIDVGWATAKYIEMMNGFDPTGQSLGTLPLYTSTYDTQGNTIPLNHFLRCTPENFKSKLERIFNDDEFAKKLYRWQLKYVLTPDLYTGKHVSDVVMNAFNDSDIKATVLDPDSDETTIVEKRTQNKKTVKNPGIKLDFTNESWDNDVW